MGVPSAIAGQAVLWRNPRILAYGAVVATCFNLTVHLYEEPRLHQRFGDHDVHFTEQVPRRGHCRAGG